MRLGTAEKPESRDRNDGSSALSSIVESALASAQNARIPDVPPDEELRKEAPAEPTVPLRKVVLVIAVATIVLLALVALLIR